MEKWLTFSQTFDSRHLTVGYVSRENEPVCTFCSVTSKLLSHSILKMKADFCRYTVSVSILGITDNQLYTLLALIWSALIWALVAITPIIRTA